MPRVIVLAVGRGRILQTVMIGFGASVLSPREDNAILQQPPSPSPPASRKEGVSFQPQLSRVDVFTHRISRWYRRRKYALRLVMVAVDVTYIFVTVPLRIAFFFDPYADPVTRKQWTKALVIYSAFDALSDIASILSLSRIYRTQQHAVAAVVMDPENVNIRVRQRPQGDKSSFLSRVRKTSSVIVWSLNTIVPTMKHQFDIKRPLMYEAVAMAPLELLAIWFGVNSLHALRAHKLFRLHRVSDCVTEIKKLYARSKLVRALEFPGNSLLLNRIALGLVLCHLIACIYMGLAHWQCGLDFQLCTRGIALSTTQQSGTTEPLRYTCWAIEDQLVGATPLRKYARSIYFASRSMLNVGYYDTTPATDLETLYAIVVQVISAIFSTSMIATFIFLFRYLNYRKQAFMAHVDEAKEYMKISKVPEDVRDAVLNFYNSVWEASGGLSPGDIVQSLPGHLRVRVTSVLITQRVQQVAFLAKESVEFLNTLTLKMEPNVFSANDWIIEKVPNGMYFVLYGSVTIELVGQSQLRYAKAGEHFAEFALLFPGRTDERARAQTYCQLYKLSRRWFHETMELFHRDKASGQIELMQAMLNRRDQQQQKMKKMLGRSVDEFGGASSRTITSSGLNLGRRSRIPWNLPGSAFRKWWELLRLLFLTFVSYEVPFFIVFDTAEFPFTKTPTYNIQSVTSLVVEVFFTVDFILRCRLFAFIDPLARIPVTDATYIFDWYKTKGLWWDLISIIPVSTILEFSYGSKWMIGPVFRLVRMLRLRHFPSVIQDLVQTRGLSSKAQLAIALLLLVTLSFHITGCLWFLMARMSIDEDHFEIPSASLSRTSCLRDVTLYGNCSWAVFDAYGQIREGFPSLPIGRLDTIYSGKLAYIRSVYWAIVALTTVGYGDIVAFSTHETLFSALWSFIGGVINYAVVSGMSDLASNWTAARRAHMEKTNDANITFARYRVSEDVRTQIRLHYHQQFYMQKVTTEAKLLMHLPQQLRHRISLILHAEAVKKIPLFVDYGSERLLHDITGQFRRAVFQRGDSLVHENAICDEAFVIISGRANMFCKRTGAIPAGALHTGACHGVAAMVLHLNSPATVVAATVVEVSSITHQAFSATMDHHFPNDIASLKARANDQYVVETSTVSAIVQNLLDRKKLRHSKRCTTMFVSSGSTNDQMRKEQLRFYWDIAIMCIMAFHGLEVPFRIPFMHRPLKSTWIRLLVVDLLSDLLLWLDILLKMYYFDCDAGLRNLITRETKNASYAEYNLKQDLWSQLPLYYVGDNYLVMNLCRLPRLIRLTQLSSLIDSLIIRLQQRFSPYGNISAYLRPFKLMLFLIFVSHLCGCVFYLVSDMDTNPNSWLRHDVVLTQENFSPFALYLRSFYWALTTFTLVGTKDIVPLDTIGTIFACFTCLCCTFIVGVILGELSELVLDMDKAKKLLHERESRIEEFAKDHDLPTSLRLRATRYLKFQHSHQKGMNIYEMFEDLPQNLRVQLMMDLHGNLLRHLPISKYLSETQINRLAIRLRSELYIASDTVLVEGDPGLKLCILKKGSAQVVWKSTSTAVATLSVGSLFGEVAFFLNGVKRIASVQMTASSELLVIDRRSWKHLMDSCDPNQRKRTETAIMQWVHDCLKSYNVMTIEIVNDIKSTALDSEPRRRPIDLGQQLISWQSSRKSMKQGEQTKPSRSRIKPLLGRVFGMTASKKVYIVNDEVTEVEKNRDRSMAWKMAKRPPSVRRVVQPFVRWEHSTRHFSHAVRGEQHDLTLRRLVIMEDESWRRYKISIMLAELVSSTALQITRSHMHEELDEAAVPDSMLIRANSMPHFVANPGTGRVHWSTKALKSSMTVKPRRRRLRRTQSLPLFYHHFEEMIACEQEASSVVDLENQLKMDPRQDFLRKAQQPEFAFLFRLYVRWKRRKHEADRARIRQPTPTKRWSLLQYSATIRKPAQVTQLAGKFSIEDQSQTFFELLSQWHRLWECMIVLIAVFYATSLPLLISFSSRTETLPGDERVKHWEIYVLTIDVLCIIDFLLKYSVFRYIKKATGEEEEVKTQGVVSKRFVFDLITALPLELLLRHPAFASLCKRKWYYLSILQCNKIPRIFEGQEASGRLAQVFAYDLKLSVRDSTLRFIRSIGTFVLSGHWIACLWYFASVPSYEHYGISWFTTPKMLALDHFTSLADVSYWRRYLRSAHFSAGSISTVFYGDIGSANLIETIFELLINLIAIFVFGVLTGAHSEHLEATYKHRMRFEQDLVELYHYLKDNDVPREIRKRLKLYYLNTWLRYRGHDDFEGVQGLSTLLVEDIAQYKLRGFSSSVSIFQSCDECFLRALLTCLKHIVCSPSEQIVRKGDVDRSMYFISHGKVLVEGTGFQLVKEEGDFFGELSLLYGIPRSATCSSLGTSLLYALEWEAYERILLDYPEYRRVNRREWVIVSTKLRAGDLRFRSIIDIVSRMENASWVQVDEILSKAKNLK